MTAAFQYLRGCHKEERGGVTLFTKAPEGRTRNNGWKVIKERFIYLAYGWSHTELIKERSNLELRRNFLTINQWNSLPPEVWLRHPGPRNEKRTLFCDMACFLFITPLAAISGWLCLRGAQDHMQFNSHLEAIGLIALTIALFTIYVLWTLVSFRYHCQLYSEWRRTNQKVRLMIPDARNPSPAPHSLLSAKLLKKKANETTV
ncbi:E3 ubiquitin-protein ligase MARCHF2 isoform 2-T7 [Vipera latastei]